MKTKKEAVLLDKHKRNGAKAFKKAKSAKRVPPPSLNWTPKETK